jgi:integrase/recombinase XerD
MVRLLESASGNTEAEIRDRALLELWYASGLRVSEVAGLKESDIKKEEGVILVRGKGGRERLVPVNALALEACEKYQSVRHETQRKTNLKDKGYFFLNRAGKKLTRQAVWKLVKKYAEKAGISRAVWPHMIRHSFATHVLQGGADLRAVQEMLGHRSITTTEVYTHLDIENLKVMQLKYHPRS